MMDLGPSVLGQYTRYNTLFRTGTHFAVHTWAYLTLPINPSQAHSIKKIIRVYPSASNPMSVQACIMPAHR